MSPRRRARCPPTPPCPRTNPAAIVNWFPVLLLGFGAFLAGGAYSMYSQGKRPAMVILIILATMAIIAGALYAWNVT